MVMAQAEVDMETNGIKFNLDISDMTETMYGELLGEMLAYIGRFTDTEVNYLGDWEITIKAKDVEFVKGE